MVSLRHAEAALMYIRQSYLVAVGIQRSYPEKARLIPNGIHEKADKTTQSLELHPEDADQRCPRLECAWRTKNRANVMMFDCENHETVFCRASRWPWRPDDLKSGPVPPLSLVDWTDIAQTARYEFMEQRLDYIPPYESLPYTISFRGRRFFELYRRSQSPEESSDDGLNHGILDEHMITRELSLKSTKDGTRIDNMLEDEPE